MQTHEVTPELAQEFFRAKLAFTAGPMEVASMLKNDDDDVRVVDVRTKKDFDEGHVPGAVNLPKGEWKDAGALAKDGVNARLLEASDS